MPGVQGKDGTEQAYVPMLTDCMLEPWQGAGRALPLLVHTTALQSGHYGFHFTDEETEA